MRAHEHHIDILVLTDNPSIYLSTTKEHCFSVHSSFIVLPYEFPYIVDELEYLIYLPNLALVGEASKGRCTQSELPLHTYNLPCLSGWQGDYQRQVQTIQQGVKRGAEPRQAVLSAPAISNSRDVYLPNSNTSPTYGKLGIDDVTSYTFPLVRSRFFCSLGVADLLLFDHLPLRLSSLLLLLSRFCLAPTSSTSRSFL